MMDSGDGAIHEVRVDFQNGRSVPIGLDKIPVHTSYFIGRDDPVMIQPELRWRKHLPALDYLTDVQRSCESFLTLRI